MLGLPPLAYPITRDFRCTWVHAAGYAAILLSIPFLIVLNLALTGYQDVTRVSINYNASQILWFNGFIPSAKPGSLCDPYILTLGDTFSTNYNIFKWTITSIATRAGNNTVHQAGVQYKSQPLICDAAFLELTANVHSFSVSMTAFSKCITPEFSMTLTGTFTATSLQLGSTLLSGQIINENAQRSAEAANALLSMAAAEVLTNIGGAAGNSRTVGVEAFSAIAFPDFCSRRAEGSLARPDCVESTPPAINITIDVVGASTGTTSLATATSYLPYFNATLSNAFQTMHAAVRLDFGPTLPNNFLTNASVAPLAITPTYPALSLERNGTITSNYSYPSLLYKVLTSTAEELEANSLELVTLPLYGAQNSIIQVPYLCHFAVRKSMGPLIVSVLVATLSMFSAGWGVLLLIASYFARRSRPGANFCEHHEELEGQYGPATVDQKPENGYGERPVRRRNMDAEEELLRRFQG